MILNPGDTLESPRWLLNPANDPSSSFDWPEMELSGTDFCFLSWDESNMLPGFGITSNYKSTYNFHRSNKGKRNTITQMHLGHLKKAGTFF